MNFNSRNDVDPVEFLPGIERRTMLYHDLIMLCQFTYKKGACHDTHSHEYEQTGYLLKGKMKFTVGDETRVMSPNDAYIIPPGVEHRAESLEDDTRSVEVFSPVREDYKD